MADPAKQALRSRMKELLAAVPAADAAAWSAAICQRIVRSGAFLDAQVVMLYWPMAGEVNIRPIAAEARRLGKAVCLPRTDWGVQRIIPVRADAATEPGRFGLVEPPPEAPAVPLATIGLVLVPGLAFDLEGHRLGRGAGFYDRFLADPALRAATCGVAFDPQIVDSVPVTGHDIPIQWIATPSRLVATGRADNP